jgi:hypothetical protein
MLGQACVAEQVGQPAPEMGVGAVVPVGGQQQLGDSVHGRMRRVAQAEDVGLQRGDVAAGFGQAGHLGDYFGGLVDIDQNEPGVDQVEGAAG